MTHIAYVKQSAGMRRFASFVCFVFLILLVPAGVVADDSAASDSEKTGGHITFETTPTDATIWLDGVKIGTSPFTYYSEKTGTLNVVVTKRLYQDYTGSVIVNEGERAVFTARLIPVLSEPMVSETPSVVMTTATIPLQESPITVPTPWPSPTESPVNPGVVVGAVALCAMIVLYRRG